MRTASIAAAGLLMVAAYVAYRDYSAAPAGDEGASAPDDADDSPLDAAVEWVADAASVVTEGYLMPVSFNLADQNLRAFLRMIRYCEGTANDEGYRTLFGGRLFDGFTDHPRVSITARLGGGSITSTAAGAYQFLVGTWDECRAALGLADFSPASQDMAAAYLIRRRGALGDVYAGRFGDAVRKCGKEWSSLPGSPYGQPVKTMNEIQRVYVASGGLITGGTIYA